MTCDSFLSIVLSIYPNIAAEKFEKLTKDTMVVMIKLKAGNVSDALPE